MTIKYAAKTAAYAAGMFIFGVKPKSTPTAAEPNAELEARIAATQAAFLSSVKEDLK
jgi:hypothetical protein